jgi:hypothetical protein
MGETIPVAVFSHAASQPYIMHSRSAHHSYQHMFQVAVEYGRCRDCRLLKTWPRYVRSESVIARKCCMSASHRCPRGVRSRCCRSVARSCGEDVVVAPACEPPDFSATKYLVHVMSTGVSSLFFVHVCSVTLR